MFAIVLLLACASVPLLTESAATSHSLESSEERAHNGKCRHSGERFVKDYIQFQCFSAYPGGPLSTRPIGCVPSNRRNGQVIPPGSTYTTVHFRYACDRESESAVLLRITHCVDQTGSLVKIGDFFTQKKGEDHVTIECAGDELRAKKIVHKWTKCELGNGEKLVEGNFITEDVPKHSLHTVLQKAEIITCVRTGADVSLKCTGCVASSGVHVGVSGYANVDGQWTQCRRFQDNCRLINVTSDYVDCQFEGKTYPNGGYFTSRSGVSSYYCNQGVVTKQGCLVEGELVLVGDVRYVNDRPLLCEQRDEMTQLGRTLGCDLPDGRFKRYMEVWQDASVMKRCSWTSSEEGIISEVTPFACVDGKEQIPLNRIIQRPNGDYFKCASDGLDGLELRALTKDESEDNLKKKTLRNDLVEYYGNGGRGGFSADPFLQADDSELPKLLSLHRQRLAKAHKTHTAALAPLS
ncbi:Protein F25E2.2 a [Aphelenchoides avenae]|nr:Protein F25E2.2 a [Aphelenchus avenae]